MRRHIPVLAVPLVFTLFLMSCTLFGAGTDATEEASVLVVTATPADQTTPAPAATAGPTETSTPTPTLHPIFPTPVLIETHIAEQKFERGWAFAIQDRAEIWIAAFTSERGGTWTIYEDEFYLHEQATGEELFAEFDEEPPVTEDGELVLPIRGFGWIWINNPEVREALGWGLWIELGQVTTLRYDAGGLINDDGQYVPRPGRFTLVDIDGDTFIFDESTESFTWNPAP